MGNVDYSSIKFDEKAKAVDTWRRAANLKIAGLSDDPGGTIAFKLILHEIERIIIHKTADAPDKRLQGKIRLTAYADLDKEKYLSIETTTETKAIKLKDYPNYHLELTEKIALETLGYQVDGSYDDFTVYWDSVSSIRISQLESGVLDLYNPELGRTFVSDPSLMATDD